MFVWKHSKDGKTWHTFPDSSAMRWKGPDLGRAARTCNWEFGGNHNVFVIGNQIHLVGKVSYVARWKRMDE